MYFPTLFKLSGLLEPPTSNHSVVALVQCNKGWEGTFCTHAVQVATSSSGLDSTALAAVLGAVIPSVTIVLLLGLVVLCVLVVVWRRSRGQRDQWEIDPNELELEEHLGTGGYGEVYRAKWRGTEVAVKFLIMEDVNKELERGFVEEVRTRPLTRSTTHSDCSIVYVCVCVLSTGASDDGVATSQRGAVHGRVDQEAQDVHSHGAHGPRFPL